MAKEKFEKWKMSSRSFLEPHNHNVDSYINWYVEVVEDYENSELKIADCSRAATFYLGVDADGLRKLDRLIAHLQEHRSALIQGIKKVEQRERLNAKK